MFDTTTPEPIPGDWQEPAPRKENKIARDLKKAEFGMGIKVYQSIQKKYEGNPRHQAEVFFDLVKIPSGTGRARTVSLRTTADYRERTLSFLETLETLNMKANNLHQISPKQVQAVFAEMEKQGMSASRLANTNTTIRRLGVWLGKPNMCPTLPNLMDEPWKARRRQAAHAPKDWEANGAEVLDVIEQVSCICETTALHLRLAHQFGVRVQEFLMFKPLEAERYGGTMIHLREGTKGGRARMVPIETQEQRDLMVEVKRAAAGNKKGLLIYEEGATLRQAIMHFYYVLEVAGINRKTHGITAHGLRHGYACRMYKLLTGHEPPVLGGPVLPPEVDRKARLDIAERLGHSRVDVTSAYLGSHKALKKYAKENLGRMTHVVENDPVLKELAAANRLKTFCIVGHGANGEPFSKKQAMFIGYEAQRVGDETVSDANRRVLPGVMDMAIRMQQALGIMVAPVPLVTAHPDADTYDFHGLTV